MKNLISLLHLHRTIYNHLSCPLRPIFASQRMWVQNITKFFILNQFPNADQNITKVFILNQFPNEDLWQATILFLALNSHLLNFHQYIYAILCPKSSWISVFFFTFFFYFRWVAGSNLECFMTSFCLFKSTEHDRLHANVI